MSLPRASSPAKAEYDELSSPDPLGNSSQDFQKNQTSPSRRGSRGLTPSNIQINKQQARLSIDPDLSPSKTVTEQTLSPWRIRVTVEAEPEEGFAENEQLAKTRTVTRTMKIPLRDESSPSAPISTSRRNSTQTSAKKGRRRSGTPDPTRRTRRPSLTDLDAIVLGDDRDEDEWSVKNSPSRKRRNSKSKTGQKKSAGSRRGSHAAEFKIREDEDAQPVTSIETEDDPIHDPSYSPELRQIDLNRVSIRPRSASVKDKDNNKVEKARNSLAHQSTLLNSGRKVSTNSAMTYPTPSPSASEHGHSDQLRDEKVNEVHKDLDNGEGFDTMIESEGFTMIDLDSLPSIKHLRSSPEQPKSVELDKTNEIEEHDTLDNDHSYQSTEASIAYPVISSEDDTGLSAQLPSSPPEMNTELNLRAKKYSIGHLQIPSSTHVHRQRQVTPQTCSSPQLPSPPKPGPARDRAIPNSAKAMNAGRVLQGALTPHEPRGNVGANAGIVHHSSEEDQIFEGFDSSTRRELRAGLRFGEELAKRQKDSPTTIIQDLRNQNARFDSHVQVWRSNSRRGEVPDICATATGSKELKKSSSSLATESIQARWTEQAFADSQARLEQEWQLERDAVIEQAANRDVVIIHDETDAQSEEDDIGEDEVGNETEGDIWLAEAKNTSSPKDDTQKPMSLPFTDSERRQREKAREALEKPKRNLIPSPWKRGQQLVPECVNTTTMLSGDTSMSGLFWKESSSDNDFRFGAGIISKPDRIPSDPQPFDRRRSGEFTRERTWRQTQRMGPRHDKDANDMNNFELLARDEDVVEWRNAEEVVDEETSLLEAQKEAVDAADVFVQDVDHNLMKLHETSLEDVPEQDLSSSPHQVYQQQTIPVQFNDESVATVSDESTTHEYRQRTSLSPSKERPATPRSALKGGRLSHGFNMNASDEENSDRRVAWAKRSSCVNEEWEESSRSVRSILESENEKTFTLHGDGQERVASSVTPESESEDKAPQSGKSWFSWFRGKEGKCEPITSSPTMSSLDGTLDENDAVQEEGDYAPTSRHTSSHHHTTKQPTPATTSSLRQSTSVPSSSSSDKLPSYLLPPSYPSDPTRNTTQPLSTTGEFTNSHFRTLHIIYRKSQKPRFHAPQYPDEVRPEIQNLVERKWSMEVDEGRSPLGEVFTFKVREMESRVLERFMREVEHGHSGLPVQWSWSVEQLASWMGRIAVGEVVRAEEAQVKVKAKK